MFSLNWFFYLSSFSFRFFFRRQERGKKAPLTYYFYYLRQITISFRSAAGTDIPRHNILEDRSWSLSELRNDALDSLSRYQTWRGCTCKLWKTEWSRKIHIVVTGELSCFVHWWLVRKLLIQVLVVNPVYVMAFYIFIEVRACLYHYLAKQIY